MLAAEKWYEYEDSYRKYGIDMKPHKKRQEKAVQARAGMYAKDKMRLLMLTVFAGIIGIAMIILSAYAAQLKYDINIIIGENTVIEGEIQNLNVQLESSASITAIEEKAINELGMVYPYGSQIVYIGEDVSIDGSFATLLKEQAYN